MMTLQSTTVRPVPTTPAPSVAHGWKALELLPEGQLDLVGDIHGEIDALASVLAHLGYQQDGAHSQGRKLVFLGDLIDRGPDSPGVVRQVAQMVARGHAVVVMGNHDLNAIERKPKAENTWLFGHGPVSPAEKKVESEREREDILDFLRCQPLARERGDLRVVHAAWDDEALATLQSVCDPVEALHEHRDRIKAKYKDNTDALTLALQNENPIKLITSGPEVKAAAPFFAGGKMRDEARHPWWDNYTAGPMVVFGHYWRIPVVDIQKDDGLFSPHPLNATLGAQAMCIDYSVGGRWCDRRAGRVNGPFTGRLAALRWPERVLVFDDGECQPLCMTK